MSLPEPELRPEPEAQRRYPSTLGGLCYMVVALVSVAGLGIVAVGDWRTGIQLIGGALVAGALCRLVLPDDKAGMLKVRRKSLDVIFTSSLGAALVTLAILVPNQPG